MQLKHVVRHPLHFRMVSQWKIWPLDSKTAPLPLPTSMHGANRVGWAWGQAHARPRLPSPRAALGQTSLQKLGWTETPPWRLGRVTHLDGVLRHLHLGVLGLNNVVLHDDAGNLDGPGVGLIHGVGLLNHLGLHDGAALGHHAGASDLLYGLASVPGTEIAGPGRVVRHMVGLLEVCDSAPISGRAGPRARDELSFLSGQKTEGEAPSRAF